MQQRRLSFMCLGDACRILLSSAVVKARESSQYLTPRTPPLHWSDWWYLQWSGLYNISLCSMDCYMSSTEDPEKQRNYSVFFSSLTHSGIFQFLAGITGYPFPHELMQQP